MDGDTLTFTIKVNFQGNDMTLNYNGKVSGDVIKFNVQTPNGDQTLEYTAKKVS